MYQHKLKKSYTDVRSVCCYQLVLANNANDNIWGLQLALPTCNWNAGWNASVLTLHSDFRS